MVLVDGLRTESHLSFLFIAMKNCHHRILIWKTIELEVMKGAGVMALLA
ncbi:hypothetical protein [Neobacillus muris]|nr:hypothetical protein [Neobacillus muris]